MSSPSITTDEDIRWTRLCSAFERIMGDLEMERWERINMGGRMISSVIRSSPPAERFRWFAFVIHSLSSEAADLNILSLYDDPTPQPNRTEN